MNNLNDLKSDIHFYSNLELQNYNVKINKGEIVEINPRKSLFGKVFKWLNVVDLPQDFFMSGENLNATISRLNSLIKENPSIRKDKSLVDDLLRLNKHLKDFHKGKSLEACNAISQIFYKNWNQSYYDFDDMIDSLSLSKEEIETIKIKQILAVKDLLVKDNGLYIRAFQKKKKIN